MQQSFSASLV